MPKISPKYQRDFKNTVYQNPRLIRDKDKKRKRIRKFFFTMVFICVAGLVYFLLYSPLFNIQKIEVFGLEKIKPKNINKLIDDYRFERDYWIFSRNNFWLFSKTKLKSKIFEHYYFEDFRIQKAPPNKIEIHLKEKSSAINWLTNNLCYHLDLTGLAIEYCEENNGFLTIKDLTDKEIKIGEAAISKENAGYFLEFYNQFKNTASDKIKIVQFEQYDHLFDVVTEQGIVIRVNSELTVEEQVARLGTLLNQEEIKTSLEKLRYIDLRFGEKVYYK